MLQNNISEYWKLDGNLVVNDFDEPYVAILFTT